MACLLLRTPNQSPPTWLPPTGAGTSGLGGAEEEVPAALSPEDRGEGTWWGGYFARGMRRGGADGEGSGQPKITIHGFREEDQENLFHLAQVGGGGPGPAGGGEGGGAGEGWVGVAPLLLWGGQAVSLVRRSWRVPLSCYTPSAASFAGRCCA